MPSLEQKIRKLPAYVYCDPSEVHDCNNEKHYLTMNRDIRGKYSVAYEEPITRVCIYSGSGFETLEAAIDALGKKLEVKA